MPILANAKKALRSTQRKTKYNNLVSARMRSSLKKIVTQPTADNLSEVFSDVDKALKRNLVHRNKATRIKSRASKLLHLAK